MQVVYKDVLDASEVEETLSKQWDFMEMLGTGVDRNDPCAERQNCEAFCTLTR